MTYKPLLFALLAAMVAVSAAPAQSIVSARSGAVHHLEGEAYVDGELLVIENADFPQLEPGNVLETGLGRAEILLTPGVVLRLAEDSSIRIDSNRLTDTRIEFLGGSALIEAMEILEDNAVTFTHSGATIQLLQEGLYRIESDPAEFRVYRGKAEVVKGDDSLVAKKARVVELGEYLVASKFDAKQDDALYRWSSRRSGYLAMANLSAARSIGRYGYSGSRGQWVWNPYFGLLTFVPGYGLFSSPFGYSYWSPSRVYMVYSPRPAFSGLGQSRRGSYSSSHGYVTVPSRGASRGGFSSGAASSAGSSSAASSGAVTRGGGSSVGRGGSGGGRGR